MNGNYKIGIDQEALYKLARKSHSKKEIIKLVGMREDLLNRYLKVDLNTQRDQMAIKLYFSLEAIIPVQEYLDFKKTATERYENRINLSH